MKQGGFLSPELTQYLVFLSLLSILIIPPLGRYASLQIKAWQIQETIDRVFARSREHYAKSVLTSRCLAQTRLDMKAINMSGNQDGMIIDVAYQQSGVHRAPPSGIRVSVRSTEPIYSLINWLKPDEISGMTMHFYAPLSYSLPDWQELNIATGCIK
ncbi:transporter [Vibrio campbellii]|uniref:transporter n=1 Tax=Vibrio campbellii TaxID=680 RepID=UPI003D130C43